MSNIAKCFFAYSATSKDVVETIEMAIDAMNSECTGIAEIVRWKELEVTGNIIITQVCDAIEECDLFICDLTHLSLNVLFELGVAIAMNKRVWLCLNSSYPAAKRNYKRLSLLSTLGYEQYHNSHELSNRFADKKPFLNPEFTVFANIFASIKTTAGDHSDLFYLKSEISTDASIRLTRCVQQSNIPIIVDDPQEVPSQPLNWYTNHTYNASAVILHFIDQVREVDSTFLQNLKYSIVAGMAYGFGKHLLMLAHAPFKSPVDYRNILKIHETAKECESLASGWLKNFKQTYTQQIKEYEGHRIEQAKFTSLQAISLGDYVAENEENELAEYFVFTAPYNEALRTSQYKLYVGRKGSGKTANLFQVKDKLLEDKRNHICIIKPVDYELEGVLSLLASNLSKVNPGYLIESLWKFLIYTELSQSIYRELELRPPLTLETEEKEFMEYVSTHQELILSEFTVRMENAITELCKLETSGNIRTQRANISETLHNELLNYIRRYLGEILSKKNKVFILVDNLDKAWKKRDDLHVLSQFLFSLLEAIQAISKDFQRKDLKWRRHVDLALVVFLRSDIFSYILTTVQEGDKIPFTMMDWTDPVVLHRVIEERFSSSCEQDVEPEEIWEIFFALNINGMPTKDYIVSRIIPRPRDIIFLCKNALSYAINHKHHKIEVDDINLAEKDYSEYVFYSLLAETDKQLNEIEALLYEFAGANEVVTYKQIEAFAEKANIPNDKIEYAIELLCDATFLGLEIEPDKFQYIYKTNQKRVLQKRAEKTANLVKERRFKINIPFHAFLGIESS